jgi:hypothetical protein
VVFGVVILLGPALCGVFCLVCTTAVQGSPPVKCFVIGGIEQMNGGIKQPGRAWPGLHSVSNHGDDECPPSASVGNG